MSKMLLWPEQHYRLGRRRTRQDPRTAEAALLAMLLAALRDACGLSCMRGWGTVWGASWVTGMDTLNCVLHVQCLSTSATSLSISCLMACFPTADAHASAAVPSSALSPVASVLSSAVSTYFCCELYLCALDGQASYLRDGCPIECALLPQASWQRPYTPDVQVRGQTGQHRQQAHIDVVPHILCNLHQVRWAAHNCNAVNGCKVHWGLHIQVTSWHITQVCNPADVVHWERLQVKVPGAACHGTALQPQSSIVTVKFCLTAACYHSAGTLAVASWCMVAAAVSC